MSYIIFRDKKNDHKCDLPGKKEKSYNGNEIIVTTEKPGTILRCNICKSFWIARITLDHCDYYWQNISDFWAKRKLHKLGWDIKEDE